MSCGYLDKIILGQGKCRASTLGRSVSGMVVNGKKGSGCGGNKWTRTGHKVREVMEHQNT